MVVGIEVSAGLADIAPKMIEFSVTQNLLRAGGARIGERLLPARKVSLAMKSLCSTFNGKLMTGADARGNSKNRKNLVR